MTGVRDASGCGYDGSGMPGPCGDAGQAHRHRPSAISDRYRQKGTRSFDSKRRRVYLKKSLLRLLRELGDVGVGFLPNIEPIADQPDTGR